MTEPLTLDDAYAIATTDRDELHSLCVRTLTEFFGTAPEVDEDGDIAVPVHGFGLYIAVAEDGPELHLWASILDHVNDRALAADQLLELAHEWPQLRFVLDRNHLLVSVLLDADPFTPQHLVNLVETIHELTHELDDDVAGRFGAALDCDADDDSYPGDCAASAGGCGCGNCDCGSAPSSNAGELGATIPVGAPES